MRKSTVIGFLALVFVFAFMSATFAASGQMNKKSVQSARKSITQSILKTDPQFRLAQEYKEKIQKKQDFQASIQAAIDKKKESAALIQKVQDQISPFDRMNLFLLEMKRLKAEGKSAREIYNLLKARLSLAKSTQTGSISGTITVGGAVPPGEVTVLAFDEYGYLLEAAMADVNTGAYTIYDLEPGDYFVVTESPFVDEMYNDVLLADFHNWRMAQKVHVSSGAEATGIDFDLQKGATVRGTVTMAANGMPLPFNLLTIKVFSAMDPSDPIQTENVFTNVFGEYEFNLGEVGSFKIYAEAPGFEGEFYNNQPDWASATPVTITDPAATIENIDFSLEIMSIGPPIPTGSTILGSVTSQIDGSPLNFVLVLAINMADTSLGGLGISGLFFGKASQQSGVVPNYAIAGLDSGTYIVMATDILGGYSREFYKESSTLSGATPVVLAENDTAMNVDFTLDLGGSISGTVLDDTGNPLPNVLVVALKGDFSNLSSIFTSIDVGFDSTDESGAYTITGISTGDYFVRTFTLLSPYSGMFLDEWYENVYPLLGFMQATPVPVEEPNATTDINFQLERAGVITGKILDSSGANPVFDVGAVVVLDASTGFPKLGIFEYTGLEDGSFYINNLESGEYKLFAFVNPDAGNMYLSEFYDGAPTFDLAATVNVTMGDTTGGINFTLEQGGVIQGFVELSSNYPAGGDTLFDFPVVAYEATTGKFAGAAAVTFSGGFRIPALPAGDYKISALPVLAPFSATYFGGGSTFDDANSQTVTVAPMDSQKVTIVLKQANGQIGGTITNAFTNDPIDRVIVFAYDQTGHAVGAGMSGYEIGMGIPLGDPGTYIIPNLEAGTYYVRTFALFSLIESLTNLDVAGGALADPLSALGQFGGMFGPFYMDEWYDDTPVELPPLTIDTAVEFIRNLQYDIFGIFPFAQMPPDGASSVAVTDGSLTGGVDFALGEFNLEGLRVSVDETPKVAPTAYKLEQSYPNPIRQNELPRGVQIRFELAEAAQISVSIYNILGQKVATLVQQKMPAGVHRVRWNGIDQRGRLVPSGVYFYSLEMANGQKQMKKLVVLR